MDPGDGGVDVKAHNAQNDGHEQGVLRSRLCFEPTPALLDLPTLFGVFDGDAPRL
jgi:hypothetical protein